MHQSEHTYVEKAVSGIYSTIPIACSGNKSKRMRPQWNSELGARGMLKTSQVLNVGRAWHGKMCLVPGDSLGATLKTRRECVLFQVAPSV